MAEHYTKNTVAVNAYCTVCKDFTMHDVFGGRKGACKVCIKRLEDAPKVAPPAKQDSLF